ncbi:MAG: UvrD-helicase domain-containing protein, partial [Rhodospirillaceae bacterium]|nr:UvrD-helicase domain-containing protein [Rhodospirillaceae bacterium]
MISKLNDPEILQRKATNNKKSAWVTASAGTGKTKILIDRLLSLLLAGNLPERLLCLAFTRAAAAEITNRVFERLSNWTTCENKRLITDLTLLIGHPPNKNMIIRARRLFAQVLDTPGGMKIETIHAFCQSLLRRFPLEAGLASHFQIMSDYDTSEILSITREEILNSISNDNCSSLTKAISTIIGIINETDFLELINELIRVRRRLSQLFNRYNGLTGLTKVLYKDFNLKQEETAELLLQKTITETSFDICGCRNAVNVLMTGSKSDHNKATVMIAWMNSEPSIRIKDFSKWCSIFLTKKNTIRSNLCTKNIKIQFPETLLILETEAKRLVYTINRLNSIKLLTNTIAVLTLAEALFTSYDHKKKARAMLDYDDLILNTIALLEQPNITPWVLYKLDGGIDHILIDEAQDINPEQWRVIKALTGEFFVDEDRCSKDERTIFVVGDDKQLIYSFQGADPREFELMRQYYKNQILTAKGKWIEIEISTSFRSAPAILKAVDLTINSISYDKEIRISDYKLEHLAFRQGVAGLVEVWPIICSSESRLSEPSIESEPWHPNIKHINNDHPRSRLAKLIARRIEIMINSGEILISRKRAICPSDILILVRHRSIFVEELVRELKALNIAVSGIDRMILTEQPIVMDLVALANVLLLPNDDLTLATVLKSPLIGLSEDDLFNLAHNRTVGLWETLKIRAEEPSFTTIWQKLSEWQHMANQMSPHDFFIRVLSNDGKKRLLAYLGAEAEDPLDEFITLTLVYERTYPPSLQNFLHWLEQDSIE